MTDNNQEADRYDPVSLMFKERVIMVAGQVNTQMACSIIAQLKKLEFMDNKAPIQMIINSPGGSVIDGMAIFDAMRQSPCPIETVGNGMQASMGSILLAGGDARAMTKNSMLLVHQIMGGAEGGTQHSDFEISGSFMALLHEKLKSVYVEFTGLNHKFWDIVGERDSWLTAEQALKIGYINGIVDDKKPGGKYAADAVRGEKKEGLQAALDKTTKDYIAQMTADQIVKAINSGSSAGGVYSRIRGELIVKLAEFPEFWTDTKKSELAAAAKASNIANDNSTKSPTAKKKTGNGPAAS
jgi:ATP-dependent Clp protease protease subunit